MGSSWNVEGGSFGVRYKVKWICILLIALHGFCLFVELLLHFSCGFDFMCSFLFALHVSLHGFCVCSFMG